MARPKRLYRTEDGRYYHLVGKKRKYIKVPVGISQKQISKINIKNIINLPVQKRLKRKKKRVNLKYEDKVVPKMEKPDGLPYYLFQPKKKIPSNNDTTHPEEKTESTVDKFLDELDRRNNRRAEIIEPYRMTPDERRHFREFTSPGRIPFSEPKPKKGIINKIFGPKESKESKEPKEPKTQEVNLNIRPVSVGAPGFEDLPGPAVDTIASYLIQVEQTAQDQAQKLAKEKDSTKKEKELARLALYKTIPESERKAYIQKRSDSKHNKHPWVRVTDKRYDELTRDLRPTEWNEIEKKYHGKGSGEDQGLYNDQIENLAKYRIKHFVPVVPADGVAELPNYIHKGMKTFSAVVNTSPSTSDGSGNDGKPVGHWTSVFVDNRDDYPSVEFFDPLASHGPTPELIDSLHKIANKMNPEKMFLFKQNQIKRQSNLSSSCGYHSVKFLDDRNRAIPFSEATGFDDYISKHPVDDSKDGEKDVQKYIRKFKQYI